MANPGAIKNALSYLVEWPIITLSSPYNPILKVVLHKGRYKLIAHNAIYSFGDLYSNYRRTFELLKWDTHEFRTCLVLGLGMASIPDMLVTKFKRNMEFTAVEIDEVVIKLAYEYVLKPKGIPVQVFTGDAASFISYHEKKYDLICSDVFSGDVVPESLETLEALKNMRDLLLPGGLLLYNRLGRYKSDKTKSLRFFEEVFRPVFPESDFLELDGNWMLINRPDYFKKP